MSNAVAAENNIIQLQTEVEVEQREDIISKVKTFEIKDQSGVDASVELERDLKANLKAINDGYQPIVSAAYQAHKDLKAKQNAFCKPVEEAISTIQKKRNAYLMEQERIRREREAEEARQRKAQEDAERLRQAEVAEENGDTEGAEAILTGQTAVHTPMAPASEADTAPKTDGLVTKKVYTGHVEDLMKLVKTIADGRSDLLYLITPDQSAINKLAAAQKENFKVPGIRLDIQTKTHTRV